MESAGTDSDTSQMEASDRIHVPSTLAPKTQHSVTIGQETECPHHSWYGCCGKDKQDRQCTHNVTLRRVHETFVVVERK